MCNGLLWPDRTPKPAAWECKALQAPLIFELQPREEGDEEGATGVCVALHNRQYFAGTDGLALSWRALADGAPVGAHGWRPLALPLPLAPRERRVVQLPATWRQLEDDLVGAAEACLEVRALLVQDEPWAGQVRGAARANSGGLRRLLRASCEGAVTPFPSTLLRRGT